MKSIAQHTRLLLVGNADLEPEDRDLLRQWNGPIVCADGGLRHLDGRTSTEVIGDGDSADVQSMTLDQDQNTNDLEKCLRRHAAPAIIGIGFLGGRWDHSLANLMLLTRWPALTLLHGAQQISAHHNRYQGDHAVGSTVGVIPIEPCDFQDSVGLEYSLKGVRLEPRGWVGSSNKATAERVSIVGQGWFWLTASRD